jgi:DNA transformation protein
MAVSQEFLDFLQEALRGLGPVDARRMFGGAGLSVDGLTFAIVADEALWLKVDDETRAAFEAEGCEPFAYTAKGGRRVVMSYQRVPDRLLDDTDELVAWGRMALAAARRSATRQRARAPRGATLKAAKQSKTSRAVGPRKGR